MLALSMLLYRPYHANFGLAYSSIELLEGRAHAPWAHYLMIHGLQLFVLTSYLLPLHFVGDARTPSLRALRVRCAPAGERRRAARRLYGLLVRCQTPGL